MLSGAGARNKTRECQLTRGFAPTSRHQDTPRYYKAGMRYSAGTDECLHVNVHGTLPTAGLSVAILMLDLAVWLDAAMRVVG